MINILVVENDIKLNQNICRYLSRNGFHSISCYSSMEAYEFMDNNLYDLIISDIMLPNIDGFEMVKTVRSVDKKIPILLITDLSDIETKQKGFGLGIDDYMVKPINMDELLLRVGALLRRANIAYERKLTIGNLVMNADEMIVTVEGKKIHATLKEFDILLKMLSYPNRIFKRTELMDEFWGMESETDFRVVDVYIAKLRSKFSCCKDFKIETVYGIGYKVVVS